MTLSARAGGSPAARGVFRAAPRRAGVSAVIAPQVGASFAINIGDLPVAGLQQELGRAPVRLVPRM